MSPDAVLRALNEGVMKRVADSLSLQERRLMSLNILSGVNPAELRFAFRSRAMFRDQPAYFRSI